MDKVIDIVHVCVSGGERQNTILAIIVNNLHNIFDMLHVVLKSTTLSTGRKKVFPSDTQINPYINSLVIQYHSNRFPHCEDTRKFNFSC